MLCEPFFLSDYDIKVTAKSVSDLEKNLYNKLINVEQVYMIHKHL